MPRLYRTRVDVPLVSSFMLQLLLHVSHACPQVNSVRLDLFYGLALEGCGDHTNTRMHQ